MYALYAEYAKGDEYAAAKGAEYATGYSTTSGLAAAKAKRVTKIS